MLSMRRLVTVSADHQTLDAVVGGRSADLNQVHALPELGIRVHLFESGPGYRGLDLSTAAELVG
jgi:hypothetical protein